MTVKIDMDMPSSCKGCRFLWNSGKDTLICLAYSDYEVQEIEETNKKPSWCPLQEVKE